MVPFHKPLLMAIVRMVEDTLATNNLIVSDEEKARFSTRTQGDVQRNNESRRRKVSDAIAYTITGSRSDLQEWHQSCILSSTLLRVIAQAAKPFNINVIERRFPLGFIHYGAKSAVRMPLNAIPKAPTIERSVINGYRLAMHDFEFTNRREDGHCSSEALDFATGER